MWCITFLSFTLHPHNAQEEEVVYTTCCAMEAVWETGLIPEYAAHAKPQKSWTSYAGLLTDGKHFHIGGQRLMHYDKPGHALDCVALQLTCLTKGTAVMESKIYFRTYHLCAVLKYFTEVSITFHAHLLLSLLQKIGEYSCTLHYMYLAVKINFLYTNHLTLTLNLNISAS